MAILKNGLLGNSKKAIGNLVTYVSKGQQIARTKAANFKDAKTEEQIVTRNKLTAIVEMFRLISPAVKVSFPEAPQTWSAYNQFVSLNTKKACVVVGSDVSIDFSQIQTAKGSLLKPSNVEASASAGGLVQVIFDDNTNNTTGFATDKLVATLYNQDKNEAAFSLLEVIRNEGGVDINTPADWAGDEVSIYINFVSADMAKASDSVYVTDVTILA